MTQFYKLPKPFSNRNASAFPLKEVFEQFLDTYKLRSKYNETSLLAKWESIVGQGIAKRTTEINFKNKKLYIQLNSAPLRNELFMAKTKFIALLNDEIGENIVEDIIFI